MFLPEKCDLCDDCLVECKYINYERTAAIAESAALIEGRPIRNAGAESITFMRPVCVRGLGSGTTERGMDIYMLSDLCRLALGEELAALSG